MKNSVLLTCILGLGLLASCSKVEVQYPEQAKEIKLTPVVESSNPVTKVPVLGSGGMVVGDMFLVSSYIAKSDNQHKGAFGNFFTNIPFLHTSNGWSGGQYWPFSHCVINFSAITKQLGSNRKVEIEWDEEHPASHAKVTLTGNDDNSQMDLMYGGTRGVYDENGYHVQPLQFKHTLCWINFKFKASKDNIVSIKKVLVKANYNGVLDVDFNYDDYGEFNADTYSTATWTPDEMQEMAVLNHSYTGEALGITLNTTMTSFGGGLMAIPSSSPERVFTIIYTVKTPTGDGNTIEKEYVYEQPALIEWKMGMRYTYQFEFSASTISMQTTNVEWVDQNGVDSSIN